MAWIISATSGGPRDTLDGRRRHGPIARTLLAVCLIACFAPVSAQALFGPSIVLVEQPSDLRPGQAVRVVARVAHVGACRLALAIVGGATAQSSVEAFDGASQIVWSWRVPKRPGAGLWHGTIECWRGGALVGTRPPDVRHALAGTLQGRQTARPALVDGDGVSVAGVRRVSGRSLIQRIGDYAVAAGLFGILFIALGLRAQKRLMRAERITRLTERYNGREFLSDWSRIMLFLTAADEPTCLEVIRVWEATATSNDDLVDPAARPRTEDRRLTRNDIVAVMNFHEECATLFNLREIDDRLVLRSFGLTMAQAFEVSWWWIHYRRRGKRFSPHALLARGRETEEFAEWERMVRTMVRRRASFVRTTKSGQPLLNLPGRDDCVRALCLPDDTKAPRADWDAHGRLSEAVGDLLRRTDVGGVSERPDYHRLEMLAQKLRAAVGRAGALGDACPARTLLIPHWRRCAATPRRPVRALTKLAALVDRRAPFAWLRSLAARIAEADQRVRYHRSYQDLAILIDLHRATHPPEETQELVESL